MKRLIAIMLVTTAGAFVQVYAREDARPVMPPFREVDSPAARGAGEPYLHTAPDGAVTLSWVETREAGGHRLRFAAWEGNSWGGARTVAEGADWFVNWADVPSVVAAGDGRMAAHWLEKSGDDTYAYGVRVSQSFDGGRTWSAPITPHDDGTATEHGFASLAFDADYLYVVWLDGRKYAGDNAPEEMTLRAARVDREGKLSGAAELDGRTCDCCPTAIAAVRGGFVVAYRDRSSEEVRDIYIVRYIDGAWESPRAVAADGWKINGCPVNGPAIASDGTNVAIAWFTMDGNTAVVRGVSSKDGGRTFGAVVDLERGAPLGRVAMTPFRAGVYVSWLSAADEGAAVIKYRCMGESAPCEETRTLVATDAGRSSGYPRVAMGDPSSERLLFAWTEPGETSRIRTAIRDKE